jgi:biotin-dependent carboxylase-like uncharacterized protein
MIEVLSNGALNLVQDLGRTGHVSLGVSPAGAMDAPALTLANWLVGNEAQAAGIEISLFPFRLRFLAPTLFACTGAATTFELRGRTIPSGWAAQAEAGDVVVVAVPERGARAYLALAGGVDVPLVLGSRSTDLKSGFGGLEGRGLRKGDRLEVIGSGRQSTARWRPFGIAPASRRQFHEELAAGAATIRVLAGAEHALFSVEARRQFERAEYKLTPDCNRQGYRLEGPALKTSRPLDLLSHGLVQGTVQVPPSGQPIVQMAEANTCGGYPKIANVIGADLWRLAQLRPGQRLRFQCVDHAGAVAALREQQREMAQIRHGLAMLPQLG